MLVAKSFVRTFNFQEKSQHNFGPLEMFVAKNFTILQQ